MVKILRKPRGFIGQNRYPSLLLQNDKDGIQIQVYKINNDIVTHCSQFISVKVKKISGLISGKV